MTDYQKEMESEGFMRLEPRHIQAIRDKGFCFIEVSKGHFKRITEKDLIFSAKEIEEFQRKSDSGEL